MKQYSKWARMAAAVFAVWLGMSAVQASDLADGCRFVGGIWICD